jgi:hypothetical protein
MIGVTNHGTLPAYSGTWAIGNAWSRL